MLNDLLYFFRRWRRRCKLIRVIEECWPADSEYSNTGLEFVAQVGGNTNIDWRELPLIQLELYAKVCIRNNESLLIRYPNAEI